LSGLAHEQRRDLGKKLRGAVFVGVGEVGAGDIAADAGMIKQVATGVEARLDVTQAFAIGELSECHCRKMIISG